MFAGKEKVRSKRKEKERKWKEEGGCKSQTEYALRKIRDGRRKEGTPEGEDDGEDKEERSWERWKDGEEGNTRRRRRRGG